MEKIVACAWRDSNGCSGEVSHLLPTKNGEAEEEHLCDAHFAIARVILEDPMRTRHVIAYFERTRNGYEICASCGKELEQTGSREQRYCSNACKQRAYRWRQKNLV